MMLKILSFSFLVIFASTAWAQVDYQSQGYGNASQMGAEISRLEEQIRQIRGENERLRHKIGQMEAAHQRFQEDVEFRLNGNGGSAIPSAIPNAAPPALPPYTPEEAANSPTMPIAGGPPPALPAPNAPEMGSVTIPAASGVGFETSPDPQALRLPGEGAATPRDLYNNAFRLLNQSDYVGAEKAFARFTHDYPNDPLIGNAWYWLGETFYVRREYTPAADAFRQGFQSLEDGPKAGDNLLKLAMSLAATQKDQEACVVLKQVDTKYSSNSSSLKEKVSNEISRLGC